MSSPTPVASLPIPLTSITDNSFEFLRLPHEPCVHYNERQIHSVLMEHTVEFMDLLEKFYQTWKNRDSLVQQPEKAVFHSDGTKGDWRVMPCLIRRFMGRDIKAVKVIGTNEEERVIHDKISVGKALLMHPSDHFVQATFDVCALSSFRTAALSVLAWKHASHRPRPVGIVGCGRIGFYTAYILASWLGLSASGIYDVHPQRALALSSILDSTIALCPMPIKKLIRNSSGLFLATNSPQPVIQSSSAGHLEFISSVGADADNLSELDAEFARDWSVVSESRQNIQFGDMQRWKQAGVLQPEAIAELRKAVGKPVPPERKVLFISTGTAVQDALLCDFLFTKFNET